MLCRLFTRKKSIHSRNAGPYRTSAFVAEAPPKRRFKMPSLKIDKHSKTFSFLIPACTCFVGIGFVYDALPTTMGLGVKYGASAVLATVAIFFVCMAIGNADKKE